MPPLRRTGSQYDLLAVNGGAHGLRRWESAGLTGYKRPMVRWLREQMACDIMRADDHDADAVAKTRAQRSRPRQPPVRCLLSLLHWRRLSPLATRRRQRHVPTIALPRGHACRFSCCASQRYSLTHAPVAAPHRSCSNGDKPGSRVAGRQLRVQPLSSPRAFRTPRPAAYRIQPLRHPTVAGDSVTVRSRRGPPRRP